MTTVYVCKARPVHSQGVVEDVTISISGDQPDLLDEMAEPAVTS